MAVEQDIGVATVEDDTIPHGQPEDASVVNAGLDPLESTGVHD